MTKPKENKKADISRCTWIEDDTEPRAFDTGCFDSLVFSCETENYLEKDFKYCPYCGRKIKAIYQRSY